MTRVPHAVFTVEDVPASERFEVWKDSISCIFDVDADAETRGRDFFASVDVNMLGPAMLARTTSRGQRWQRAPSTIARDGMDHYMIQYYEQGGQRLVGGSREVEQPADGLLVYDLSRPMAARSGAFTNLSLIIPRDLLSGLLDAPDDLHLLPLMAGDPMVTMVRDHMRTLKRLASAMSAQQTSAVLQATLTLVAGCINAQTGAAASRLSADMPGADAASLMTARQLVEARLGETDLDPERLAGELGMSRAKLYRLFAPLGGVTRYIRERRLRRAMLELRDGDARHQPIYDIAIRAGFSSETTFGRAFRQRYGVSPREVRYQTAEPRIQVSDGSLDRRYEDWLLHLAV